MNIISNNHSNSFQIEGGDIKESSSLIKKPSWKAFSKELAKSICEDSSNIKIHSPSSGTSGVYFLKNLVSKGVYKPVNEAAASKNGVPENQEAFRERIGYLISRFLTDFMKKSNSPLGIKNFGVPKTIITNLPETSHFKGGLESFQKFKKGTPIDDYSKQVIENIPESEFIKLLLVDLIILNIDRHLQNILVSEKNSLVLIDQGSSFPEGRWFKQKKESGGNLIFDWMYYSFTEKKFPQEWKEFILSINAEDLYKILVDEINKNSSESLKISGEALFNSIVSLVFLQEWLKLNSERLPIRELLRCYIPESIWYVYSLNKINKNIEKIEAHPCSEPRRKLERYAEDLDSKDSEGLFKRFTTDPIFLDIVKRSWETFSEKQQKEGVTEKSNKRKARNKPFKPSASEVVNSLQLIKEIALQETSQNCLTRSTEEKAKLSFSK